MKPLPVDPGLPGLQQAAYRRLTRHNVINNRPIRFAGAGGWGWLLRLVRFGLLAGLWFNLLVFGIMAFLGYTTKTDLTKFGSLMMMALFGIIIAMLVNMFMQSETMDYIISIIGVLVFTGLTAYDVQKLKRIGSGGVEAMGDANVRKLSIMGALTLYLDFINLFLFLLRFLGNRK